jgi:hypothetical protein
MDVFVLGQTADLPPEFADPDWPICLNPKPAGADTFSDFATSPRASQLGEGEGELVALVAGTDRELLRSAAIQAFCLRDSACTMAIEPLDPNLRLSFDPTAGTATLGTHVLLAPRAGLGPVVFRRAKVREIGALRPVAEPVWDWVIRASRAGESIASWPMPDSLTFRDCRLPLLAPRSPGPEGDWLREHLENFDFAEFGARPESRVDETARRAGFYQWHDFLDESHDLSQSIEGQGENQLGDYWHAIMHRREPDYANAKYWFRRIGNQPIWRELRHEADGILAKCSAPQAPRWRERLAAGPKWDPFAFVDLCDECAADETTELALAARRIQYTEMCMLVATALQQAHRKV